MVDTAVEKIFTRNFDRPNSHTLAVYRETGGYTALPKALGMEPAAALLRPAGIGGVAEGGSGRHGCGRYRLDRGLTNRVPSLH